MKRYRLTARGRQTIKDIIMTLCLGIATIIIFMMNAIIWLMIGLFLATIAGWSY